MALTDPAAGALRGRSTRSYLLALSLALVLPVSLLSLGLAVSLQQSEQQRFELLGHEAARKGALAVELELKGLTTTLELLATSAALARGDTEAFRREALAAADIEQATVVLRDTASRQLVNTAVPAGQPLPDSTRLAAVDQMVLASGKPALSDYFRGLVDDMPLASIVVPARRNGEIAYLLAGSFRVERLRGVLRRYSDGVWRIGLIDRNGVVITRSRDPDIHGTRPPAIAAASSQAERGYFEMVATDGDPSAVAFQRMPGGWTVVGVASIGEFQKARWRRIGAALAGSLALMGLGIGAASVLANRISRPLRALEEAGGHLSQGRAVVLAPSPNAEANSIALALSRASEALRAREAELAASHARHRNLFETIDEAFAIVELMRDADGRVVDYRYIEVNPAFRKQLGRDDVEGHTRSELFPRDPPAWLDTLDLVATTGEPARFEFLMASTNRWYYAHATRLPHARDQLAVVSDDITERKRAEATRELLINELNHRVKNTLTAVQSMAAQSFRNAASVEEGLRAFTERLLALSRAHNVLTEQNWEGADLRDVARESLRAFDACGDRASIEGPSLKLTPKAALALSMVLHELATNALKHGALAAESGRVELGWSVEGDRLSLRWRESGGPPPAPSGRRGFGTRLIERSVDGDLGGSATTAFEADGLVCRLDIPLARALLGAAKQPEGAPA